jgi:hypothetical protein
MQHLQALLDISTQVVWGTSDEEIGDQIRIAEVNGWQWDGQVHWRHSKTAGRICVAVLVSLASSRVAGLNPRLLITRA